MDKTALIQTHKLLHEVANYLETDTETYDEVGVSPIAIHKSKDDHKESIFALTGDITSEKEANTKDNDSENEEIPLSA